MASYIDTTPVIENTTMRIYVNNEGVQRVYFIAPIDGYVLHDGRLDYPSAEDETIIIEGYTTGDISVPLTYNFTTNPWNLYTKLAIEVPSDQIFGGTTEDTETI